METAFSTIRIGKRGIYGGISNRDWLPAFNGPDAMLGAQYSQLRTACSSLIPREKNISRLSPIRRRHLCMTVIVTNMPTTI
jgi:hypothetical protein